MTLSLVMRPSLSQYLENNFWSASRSSASTNSSFSEAPRHSPPPCLLKGVGFVEEDVKRGRSMQIRFNELREILLNKGIELESCWRRKDDAIGTIQL
jgi:hypothetical protein